MLDIFAICEYNRAVIRGSPYKDEKRETINETAKQRNSEKAKEGKERAMAFSCVLYLKEECDGCGLCEDQRRRRNLGDEASVLRELDW